MQRGNERHKEKGKAIKQLAWPNRTHNSDGNKVRTTFGNTRKRRKSATISNLFGPHNIIKAKSSLEVDLIFGSGVFEHTSPEEIIKDIYPEIKDSIDFGDETFSELTKPIEFLDSILKGYRPLFKYEDWDLIFSLRQNKYTIATVHDINIPIKGYCVELDFLPIIRNKNRNLYDLFIGLFGLFNRKLYSTFYFDDFELESSIEYIKEGLNDEDDEDKKIANDWIVEYESGNAKIVEDEIKSSKMTLKELRKGLKSLKPNDDLEESCVKTIKKAAKLFRYKKNFTEFIHFIGEELEDGEPVSPTNYCALEWNLSDENPIARQQQMFINSNWGEYGDVPFRYVNINGKNNKPSRFIYRYVGMMMELCDLGQKVKDLKGCS